MPEAEARPRLTLEIEDRGVTAVIRCHGKLVYGCTDLLYIPVSQLLPTHKHIILNLSDLTHMDSMGLGTLVRLYAGATAKGCVLELRDLGKQVRELLIMTNLLPAFNITGEHNIRV